MYDRDGWYLFDGQKVAGPFEVAQLQNLSACQPEAVPSRMLIARKGFTQWHPLTRIEEWFPLAEETSFEETMSKSVATLQKLAKGEIPTTASSPALHSTKKKPAQVKAKALEHETPPASSFDAQRSFDHNYLVMKGRLRLGEVRSPLKVAWLQYFISLGVCAAFWAESVAAELSWHIESQFEIKHRLWYWLLPLPVLGCVGSYFLGTLIRKAEQQNHYGSISPWLAAFLGVFPPLSIFYLQSAINDHWILHATRDPAGEG